MRYRISDGNCGFNHDNWMDVVTSAEEWYWQRDDMPLSSSTDFVADYGHIREDDIEGLNAAIRNFEVKIARVCNRDPNDYNLSVGLH